MGASGYSFAAAVSLDITIEYAGQEDALKKLEDDERCFTYA
jgi:hypothetical protein